MAENRITFTFEIDDKGKIKIEELGKSFKGLDKALDATKKKIKETADSFDEFDDAIDPSITNAGLAGATLTELGRTISDLPFGIRGVANNLSQLSTLFVTLVAKSKDGGKSLNGVGAAVGLLVDQLKGPLGLILAFQSVIAFLDALAQDKIPFFREEVKEAEEATRDFATSVKSVRDELRAIELEDTLQNQALGIDKLLSQVDEALGTQEGSLQNIQNQFKAIQQLRREEAVLLGEEQLPKSLELVNAEIALNDTLKKTLQDKNDTTLKEEERLNLAKQLNSVEDAGERLAIRRLRLLAKLNKERERASEEALLIGTQGLLTSNEFIEKTKTGSQLYAESVLKGYDAVELGAKKHTRSMEEINFELAKIDAGRLSHFSNATNALAGLFGERTAAGKAFAIATATMDTYAGANLALKDPTIPNTFARIAAVTSVIATGLANVKNILAVDDKGGRTPSAAAGGAGAESQAPIFNVVGQSNVDQLGRVITEARSEPLKAYVVGNEITNQQELDNKVIQAATLG